MSRRRVALIVLAALLLLLPLAFFWFYWPHKTPFSYSIDKGLVTDDRELPGLNGGPPRLVGALITPRGNRDEFAAEEVVMAFRQQKELDAFLTRYNGTVMRSGMAQPIDGFSPPNYKPKSDGLYLIRVDLKRSTLDDLTSNMQAADYHGHFKFSSESAARLVAILARERKLPVGPNILLRGSNVPEHPTTAGGHLNAETWPWMTETGLSVGTIHAWDYLKYKNVPPSLGPEGGSALWTPTYAAIIDGGFALDVTTGVPLNNNLDYFYYGAKPIQADLVDEDGTAGGRNPMKCTGGHECPWHGQGTFGVLGARPHNQFGSAGIGGPVVVPILIKVDWTWYGAVQGIYSIADSIRASVFFGLGKNRADVISMSLGGQCNAVCGLTVGLNDSMQQAVLTAISFGAVVVAAAGNDGEDLDNYEPTLIPCELEQVICVGAIDRNKLAKSYSNFGKSVDIWAPTDILSTTNPDTVIADGDNICNVPPTSTSCDELAISTGTSASTPFVAGVVALMAALEKNPTVDGSIPAYGVPRVARIQKILQDTANASTDPKVYKGYVDAFRAVSQVRPNNPPTVAFTSPTNDAAVPWTSTGSSFLVSVTDPEQTVTPWLGDVGSARMVLTSDADGEICNKAAVFPWQRIYECPRPAQTLGRHRITATATDPFGATSTTSITINVVNRAPTASIDIPANGSVYFADQTVQLQGHASDPDGEIIDNTNFRWTSDIDGFLGAGRVVTTQLTQGTHKVTLTTTDAKGLAGQTTVVLTIAAGAGHPSAIVTQPIPFRLYSPGELITFEGSGVDPEDGVLPGTSLSWFSNVDGFLGSGNSFQKALSGPPPNPCESSRSHTITLLVRDSDGNEGKLSFDIKVGRIC